MSTISGRLNNSSLRNLFHPHNSIRMYGLGRATLVVAQPRVSKTLPPTRPPQWPRMILTTITMAFPFHQAAGEPTGKATYDQAADRSHAWWIRGPLLG